MGRAAIATLLIAALPCAGAELDGGTAGPGWRAPLYASCPEAPQPEQLDGGSWLLGPERAARNACLMETCRARNEQLEPVAAAPPLLSSGSLIADLVLLSVGLLVGIYFGWELRGLWPR